MKAIIREHLSKQCAPADLISWFEPLTMDFNEETAELKVFFPHLYFEPWFINTGKKIFEECCFSVIQRIHQKSFSIKYITPKGYTPKAFFHEQATAARKKDDEFTFDSFITNAKNEFPLTTAKELCNPQAKHNYNPFILYGKSGTGKTHILRAIYNELLNQYEENIIFFGNIEKLSQCFNKNTSENVYKQHKFFLVDNTQQLINNTSLQELFVQFIDNCLQQNIQLVFVFSQNPFTLMEMIEELRSRLGLGLSMELREPDIDVRMRFIQTRAKYYNLKLNREQILLLAQRCSQIWHLNGIILKTVAFQDLNQNDITISDLENILRHTGDDKKLTFQDIIKLVAEHFSMAPKDILGSKRQPAYVFARQTAMFLCRELLGASYPYIGQHFGGKDHSTVMHSIKKIRQSMDSNKDTHQVVTELKKKCLQA